MALTQQQLEAIVARALPTDRLRESRALPGNRYNLTLVGGERLSVQIVNSSAEATSAAAALRLLRAEFDLPVPQLRASDAEGTTIGQPYLLFNELAGEPLELALPRIGEEQLYELGRRLGEVMYRVHRLACDHYGGLAGAESQFANERDYVLARLENEQRRCNDLGLIGQELGAELRGWFEQAFKPSGQRAALVCGGLAPRTLLVRYAEGRWWLSAVLGWERALGWSPAWDHANLFDVADRSRYFGLRVGYGNSYDNHTRRAYEQVREHAMTPYQVLLTMQRMREAYIRGEFAECERRYGMLRSFLRFLID